MTKAEMIRLKLELIDDEPTPKQIIGVLYDVLDLIEGKESIGFKNDKKKK